MKLKTIALAFTFALLPVLAKDKDKVKPAKTEKVAEANVKASATPAKDQKEPWLNVDVRINSSEKETIREYIHTGEPSRKGKKSRNNLPPGLAKKVARGEQLPPGWQKKCVRGEILPEEIYKRCHPLPHELSVKLPPPPAGTILVAIEGKAVRLAKATREILDVFNVH